MKKIFSLLLFSLFLQLGWAQSGEGYNPQNPADPDLYYTLTLEASPRSGGVIDSRERMKLSAGSSTRVSASPRLGYEFKRWMMGDSVVSTNNSFSFTMPEKDLVLTAYFDWVGNEGYNPQNPIDPDAEGYSHHVYVYATPSAGGYFNSSNFMLVEGKTTNIYAYPREGYRFESWLCDGEVVSTENPLRISMVNTDITYVATFAYDPISPGEPSPNVFNSATGEVIIDNFTPGSLNRAIYAAVGSTENYDLVKKITVIGRMESGDFGASRDFHNCEFLDYSRTTGYKEIPSYSFEDASTLRTLILPINVEFIGDNAFMGCNNLKDIYLYTTTPPTLSEKALNGLNKGVVIHVPSSAVALFKANDYWNQLSIESLDDNEKSITVNIPYHDGEYKNMTLELQNIMSGQSYRYLVTDRICYTFFGLMKNTSYNIYLKNSSEVVLGEINNVILGNQSLNLELSSIKKMHDVTLVVQTPDGKNVNSDVTITWLDKHGSYLRQGNKVSELLSGSDIQYRVKLSKELAMEYVQPVDMAYQVTNGENAIVLTLSPIKQITLSGNVKDAVTKQGISGATVSISQTLNGKYSKTIIAKTDSKGYYTATIYNAPTSLAISAYDYVNRTAEVSIDPSAENVVVDDLTMTSIIGATINVSFTYTPSVAEDETAETQNWYRDYQNVAYSIFNLTTGKEVTQISNRYPQLIVLDGAKIGDELLLTAISKKKEFKDVVVTTSVDSTAKMDVVFPIKEYGGIKNRYMTSENADVVGMLYDGNGNLKKVYDYANDSILSISNLQDGNYTLITMGKSNSYNSIYSLTRLVQILLEEVDYQQSRFVVESGIISTGTSERIPYFDENKFKYIDKDKSYFRVDNTSIVVGNYLTFTGHIETKDKDVSALENIKYIVDLPPSAVFIEKSVMIGGHLIENYSLEGNTLTIMCPYLNKDNVKFCVIPTESGTFLPSATLVFTADNRESLLPIGRSPYEVKDMSISVPATTSKTSIQVSGTSGSNGTIDIFDDDVLIGQTTAQANGTWKVDCELNKPYNLSTHSIYAKLTTENGIGLLTETKDVLYDMNCIEAKTVTMSFYNEWLRKNVQVVFDLQNKTTDASSYMFYTGTDITFVADLTNNDTTIVNNVTIRVYTDKKNWRNLNATYDVKSDRWVAVSQFGSDELPIGVDVVIFENSEPLIDRPYFDEIFDELSNSQNDINKNVEEIESIANALDDENASDEEWMAAYEQISELLGIHIDTEEEDIELTDDYIQTLIDECGSIIAEAWSIDGYLNETIYGNLSGLSDEYKDLITVLTCDDLIESELDSNEYKEFKLTDGASIYVKTSDNTFELIDFTKNIHYVMHAKEGMELAKSLRRAGALDGIISAITTVKNFGDKIHGLMRLITSSIDSALLTVVAWKEAAAREHLKIWRALTQMGRDTKETGKVNGIMRSTLRWQLKYLKSTIATMENCEKLLKNINKGITGINILLSVANAVTDLNGYRSLYYHPKLDQCPDNKEGVKNIRDRILAEGALTAGFYITNIGLDCVSLQVIPAGVGGAAASMGASLAAVGVAIVKLAASVSLEKWHSNHVKQVQNSISNEISRLKCKDNKCPICGKYPCECKDKCPKCGKNPCVCDPPIPQIPPIHDPSGYVYEGVSSNRLQGVTATAYYMETTEDIYGVLHDEPRVWDAEVFDQENPLFTDENGMYQWFVPQGMWQVKFEKEGYETTYSEWLPVPPPQLEVNIGMVQSRQPEVIQAHAYKDGIEVEFDKYMLPALLNAENILVSQRGEYVEGEVKMVNEETAYADESVKYASKVRFVPKTPFTASEVTLTIANRVKSYAGLQMQNSYQQTFDIEQELKEIKAEPTINVAYEGVQTLTVQVLPAEASAGKTLNVKTSSQMIASVASESYVLDKDGKAVITVTGELPGSASLTYTIDGYDLTATTTVTVDIVSNATVATPTASIASGSVVNKGTTVELFCSTEGATIYYTLNGSCPCDNSDARKVYDGTPIVINETTTIKAIAVVSDMTESDVAEFTYIVDTQTSVEDVIINGQIQVYPLPVHEKLNVTAGGKTIKSVTVSSMNGVVVAASSKSATKVTLDVSKIPTGTYIIHITTDNASFNRKILKVE